jgi:hypothetical protein
MRTEAYQRLLRTHMQAENAHRMQETLATLTPDCLFEDLALGQVFRGHAGAREYYNAGGLQGLPQRGRAGRISISHPARTSRSAISPTRHLGNDIWI